MSVNELTKGTRFVGETLKYVFQRKGLLTLSAAHIAVFCKSRPDLSEPGHPVPHPAGDHGRRRS